MYETTVNNNEDGLIAFVELSDSNGTNGEFDDRSPGDQDATESAECPNNDDNPMYEDVHEVVGEWQDDRSRGPINKTPGASPLCDACKYIFSEFQPYDHLGVGEVNGLVGTERVSAWVRFLESLQSLEASAQLGCALCKLVSARIRRQRPGSEPAGAVKIHFQVFVHDGAASPELCFTYVCHISRRSAAIRSEKMNLHFLHIIDPVEDDSSNAEVLPHTYSTENLALIASWVAKCTGQHLECNPTTTKDDFYPTRLLDLCPSDDASNVALVESSAFKSGCQYLALSHCWGGKISLVLRNNSIDSLKSGMNLSKLPKTFQDAIALAHSLHVRYLWIDSLCIIQDSYTDWEHEASRMKDVYKYALFTIAATGARNSAEGLFFNRDFDLVKAITLSVAWQGLPKGIYTICDGKLWEDNIIEAPLNQRAWVVQERLLSPRTLHLGRDQITWECQALRACETFPEKLPEKCSTFNDIHFRTALERGTVDLCRIVWPRIATTYSQCHLTKENDKCIAISGIVEEMHLSTADIYFAGLWKSSFVPQMCWTVDHYSNEQHGETPRRPYDYRAPSWSWLSIDSSIEFYSDDDGAIDAFDILFVILDIRIENTGRNKFGLIKSGHIIGRGLLKRALWEHSANDQTRHLLIDAQTVEHGEFWHEKPSQVMMDLGPEESCTSVWCLPLLSYAVEGSAFTKGYYVGLILVATGQAEEEYKRIGCFQIDHDLGDFLLKQRTDGQVRAPLPQRSFTIV